ncbi:DUF421 domain-containing protein [Paenibacillus turpanensis]|uniref:DUF421 domain-containing protein n=1 Tax=Paenibacillus turpanensis TaxID=2689078 RepID=UPI003132BA45
MLIGWLSLKKFLYNLDSKPSIVIMNGQIDRKALKHAQMNLPFFLSLLREKGIFNVSQVEYAIVEPNGTVSVIPTAQDRPVTPKDLQLQTHDGGIGLPLIIDGEVQITNLQYKGLNTEWLENEIRKSGATQIKDVFLAELGPNGKLHVDLRYTKLHKPDLK